MDIRQATQWYLEILVPDACCVYNFNSKNNNVLARVSYKNYNHVIVSQYFDLKAFISMRQQKDTYLAIECDNGLTQITDNKSYTIIEKLL